MKNNKLEMAVLLCLQEDESARGDDFVLAKDVFEKYYENVSTFGFDTIARNHGKYGLPSFESISRIRRKMQKENKLLLPPDMVRRWRKNREQEFHDGEISQVGND